MSSIYIINGKEEEKRERNGGRGGGRRNEYRRIRSERKKEEVVWRGYKEEIEGSEEKENFRIRLLLITK